MQTTWQVARAPERDRLTSAVVPQFTTTASLHLFDFGSGAPVYHHCFIASARLRRWCPSLPPLLHCICSTLAVGPQFTITASLHLFDFGSGAPVYHHCFIAIGPISCIPTPRQTLSSVTKARKIRTAQMGTKTAQIGTKTAQKKARKRRKKGTKTAQIGMRTGTVAASTIIRVLVLSIPLNSFHIVVQLIVIPPTRRTTYTI